MILTMVSFFQKMPIVTKINFFNIVAIIFKKSTPFAVLFSIGWLTQRNDLPFIDMCERLKFLS